MLGQGTRGRSHRTALYNLLTDAGCSVLTIDYRGFGDSCQLAEVRNVGCCRY